jgi:putative flippase GtrA
LENIYLKTCFIIAASLTGLLCGASLDQSIKQLPARHRIGVAAFSAYAKAADLKNGVLWYAILGMGAALVSLITAILAWKYHTPERYALAFYVGGFFSILHSFCTMLAAPTYHQQKRITDVDALRRLFNRFERIQTFRSIFIALNFMTYIWVYFNLV